MTDLDSASNNPGPEAPPIGPEPNIAVSPLDGAPFAMRAELRRLEYHHVLDMEDRRLAEKSMELEDRRATRGQWMAFILALVFLGVLGAAVLTDAHLLAAGLMGSGITVGVGSFIYSHRQQQSTAPPGHRGGVPAAPADPAPETT